MRLYCCLIKVESIKLGPLVSYTKVIEAHSVETDDKEQVSEVFERFRKAVQSGDCYITYIDATFISP